MGEQRERAPGAQAQDYGTALALAAASSLGIWLVGTMLGGLPLHVRAAAQTIGGVGGAAWAASLVELRAPSGRLGVASTSRSLVAGLGLAIFGVGSVSLIALWAPWLAPVMEVRADAYERLLRPNELAYIPVVLLVVCLVPAVCEEWLYRGVIVRVLSGASARARVLFVAVLFAVVHFDPVSLLPLMVVGAVLGVLREQTGGWAVPAVAHFTLNAVSGVVVPRALGADELALLPACVSTAVGLAVVGAALRLKSSTSSRAQKRAQEL